MKNISRLLAWLGFLAATSCSWAVPHICTLTIEPGEHWWAGIVGQSHQMPFGTNSSFQFDFLGDTAGNQCQPLLISDHGRSIWCEDPFKFKIENGVVKAESNLRPLQVITNHSNLRAGYQQSSRAYFPPAGGWPDPLLFTRPQFNTWIELTYNQNQADILRYARAARKAGFPPGVLMIDCGWARDYGDWEFNPARFEDPKGMMKQLHGLGYKVMLWVCPYVTPVGTNYKNLLLEQDRLHSPVWLRNAASPNQPALTEWWDGFSAVADFTNTNGYRWFKGQLDHLVATYGVDGFKFDGGDAEFYGRTMLSKPLAFQVETTPNGHSESYARLGLEYPMNEFRACWKMGGQPLAQRLMDKNHSWEDLRKLIPGIITQGLMGYPFACPDMIGGGLYLSFVDLAQVDQELIVRSTQCHALMPMMQFSVAPWRVLNRTNLAICVEMAKLHARFGDEILALARESARTGEPIVRTLEYEYPGQGYAEIKDQFLLGHSLLVAPVVEKGATSRLIRFPPGTWKGDDGSLVTGPAAIEVNAPLGRLPYYRKN